MPRPLTDEEKLQLRQNLSQSFSTPQPVASPEVRDESQFQGLDRQGQQSWNNAQDKLGQVIQKANLEALQRLQNRIGGPTPQDQERMASLRAQMGMK